MNGLDAWIEGDNVCSYCGMYDCVCEPDAEDDRDPDDCMDCGVCDACIEQSRAYAEQMESEAVAEEVQSGDGVPKAPDYRLRP